MDSTQAWLLSIGEEKRPGPGQLDLGTILLGELAPDEVLVEPLLVSWEGNTHHAVQRQPIDVCRARNEPHVVLGNAGIVRVLKPGAAVTGGRQGLREGQVCMLQGNYSPDRFGYMQHGGVFGYDARGTVGLLARRTKIRASALVPLPEGTRHSLEQWAAFGIRYVTAWSNWRVAYGTWRLQVSEADQQAPHVWGWGGGTTFAELTLAQRHGARAAMIASKPSRFSLADRHGLFPIDRSEFPHIEFDDRRALDPEYEERYRASERVFLKTVSELTDGQHVSIFVDYIGAPVARATRKALAREGVITTAGWREGMRVDHLRSISCIQRHQHIHTHFARRSEVEDAMAYGEGSGWMPPIAADEAPWAYEQVPELAADFAAGRVETYFPLVRVNP